MRLVLHSFGLFFFLLRAFWVLEPLTLGAVSRKTIWLTQCVPVDRIRIAITSVAASYGIDERVLFGIIMEESHGGVGVATTYNADGLPTGGLMQASGCHGYEGHNNLAQVTRHNSSTSIKLKAHSVNAPIIYHRLISPT